MTCTADNEMSVYVNGKRLGRDNRNWKKATTFCLPKETFLVAVKAKNWGGPGEWTLKVRARHSPL